jgi:hypothetical protein
MPEFGPLDRKSDKSDLRGQKRVHARLSTRYARGAGFFGIML